MSQAAKANTTRKVGSPHPITSLPFVADRKKLSPSGNKRWFWRVNPTGCLQTDVDTGTGFALDYVRFISRERSCHQLAWIIADMPRPFTGIERGFIEGIGVAAIGGDAQLASNIARWERFKRIYETTGVWPDAY